jgi:hypothetical protein
VVSRLGQYRPWTRWEKFKFMFLLCGARASAPDEYGDWDDYRCEKLPLHFGHHHGWGRRKEWRLFCWRIDGKDVKCRGF